MVVAPWPTPGYTPDRSCDRSPRVSPRPGLGDAPDRLDTCHSPCHRHCCHWLLPETGLLPNHHLPPPPLLLYHHCPNLQGCVHRFRPLSTSTTYTTNITMLLYCPVPVLPTSSLLSIITTVSTTRCYIKMINKLSNWFIFEHCAHFAYMMVCQ